MSMRFQLWMGAAAAAGLSYASSAIAVTPAAAPAQEPKAIMMVPGKALELAIGDHHSISYFQPGQDACELTVVMASSAVKSEDAEAHGTRITVPVAPGRAMHVDGTNKQTVEYFCGPAGKKMTARPYDREGYKGSKS